MEPKKNEHIAESTPTPPVAGGAGATTPEPRRRWLWASLGSFMVILLMLAASGRMDSLARSLLKGFAGGETLVADRQQPEPIAPVSKGTFTFEELDLHPDLLFRPYTSGSALGDQNAPTARIIADFRALLDLYQQRQGIDDNFTVRAIDNRSGELLELFVLEELREEYRETESADWDAIDRLRRQHTRRLVDKYAGRGIPRSAVTVKWGRANQVLEARKRDLPYIEYEVRLARFLGLSLLSTEIGTVETFNQDWLVSAVGARSRYQMMPAVLRQKGIRHYALRSAGGSTISVFEEWHPLLTMEPAMSFLRGYVNAVGHEIPGISAYHAGPANVFNIYRKYLTEARELISAESNVLDAYAWGVTTGFESVTRGSSFGEHSRGYVPSNYGALRATDSLAIDTSYTMRAELVQVRQGENVFLSQLLRALEDKGRRLHWPRQVADKSPYHGFRFLNPHIVLPDAPDSAGVPVNGDVRFVASVDGADVQFFLPLGASAVLAEEGLDVLDEGKMRRYDSSTYADPNRGEKTMYDRLYEELVADIARFGFNRSNRAQLFELADRFAELARENPSPYRIIQNDIIQTHKGVWQWGQWQTLAQTVAAVEGELRAATRPLTPLGVTPREQLRANSSP